jgi:hypothetical protein
LCECEEKKKRESYRNYRKRRMQDEDEKERQDFYNSGMWKDFRESTAVHQFGLDLIEWNKGRVVDAETYHHIEEVREAWDKRLDKDNVIGMTQDNHNKIHALMKRSKKDKEAIQKALKELIVRFNAEYYE